MSDNPDVDDGGCDDGGLLSVVFEKRRLLTGRPRPGRTGDETVAYLDEDTP